MTFFQSIIIDFLILRIQNKKIVKVIYYLKIFQFDFQLNIHTNLICT